MLKKIYDYMKNKDYCIWTDIFGRSQKVKFKWNIAVSNDQIIKVENQYQIKIPDDYKDFLCFSNGAEIFSSDDEDESSGYQLLSLQEMISETSEMRKCGYNIKKNQIIFLITLFSNDFLMFDLEKNGIVYADVGYSEKEWKIIDSDFKNLILHLYMSNGAPFWEW